MKSWALIFSRIKPCDAANIARDLNALFGGRVDIEKLVNEGIQNALEAITRMLCRACRGLLALRCSNCYRLTVSGDGAKHSPFCNSLMMNTSCCSPTGRCCLGAVPPGVSRALAPLLGNPSRDGPCVGGVEGNCLGRHEQASELRNEAFDGAPALAGSINDNPFDWLVDADPRINPFSRLWSGVITTGSPVPDRIPGFDPPKDLRDLVWSPVSIVWQGGGEEVDLSLLATGRQLRLDCDQQFSRETAWQPLGDGLTGGPAPVCHPRRGLLGAN